jgi:hypothetical protein
MREMVEVELTPPPRLEVFPELPAVIEPMLRDLPRYEGALPDDIEPFVSERVGGPIRADALAAVRDVAFSHERMQRRRQGRMVEIGLTHRGKPDRDEAQTLLYVMYDYDANVAVEVTLDARGKKIIDVTESADQPAPVQEEVERAIRMAAADDRIRSDVSELQGSAILVSPVDPLASDYGHRQFDVRFGCADERRPRFAALVDLSTDLVVRVGDPCGANREGGDSS